MSHRSCCYPSAAAVWQVGGKLEDSHPSRPGGWMNPVLRQSIVLNLPSLCRTSKEKNKKNKQRSTISESLPTVVRYLCAACSVFNSCVRLYQQQASWQEVSSDSLLAYKEPLTWPAFQLLSICFTTKMYVYFDQLPHSGQRTSMDF